MGRINVPPKLALRKLCYSAGVKVVFAEQANSIAGTGTERVLAGYWPGTGRQRPKTSSSQTAVIAAMNLSQ
jgi:hypothetical protein